MKKKECPSCAMEVDSGAKECPICGYEFANTSASLKLIALLLALLFLLFMLL
ncbi:MAG: hypothetical protein O2887_00765 [Bacteroidetes bacterium]|nr:hypothetical protein [Bacteroidota bacterium]MDA1119021.1 hypothetical protein [Bacteroidota bacterium]